MKVKLIKALFVSSEKTSSVDASGSSKKEVSKSEASKVNSVKTETGITLPKASEVNPFMMGIITALGFFLVALLVALGLKFLAGLLITGASIGFVWKELLILLLAFLIAGAYGSVAKKGKIAGATIIWLILLTVSSLARHDYAADRQQKAPVEVETKLSSNLVYDRSTKPYLIYTPGKIYVYELAAGEYTPWRGLPANRYSKIRMMAEEGSFKTFYSDGTYDESEEEKREFEEKPEGTHFRVMAESPLTLYISVL